jgi:hypothetical protein
LFLFVTDLKILNNEEETKMVNRQKSSWWWTENEETKKNHWFFAKPRFWFLNCLLVFCCKDLFTISCV